MLAPIVGRPEDAHVREETSVLLGRLARRYACVACISGRAAADVRRLVGVGGIAYAGSHGAELLEPGSATPRIVPAFKSWEKRVRRFAAEHDTREARLLRVRIEDKGPIAAFHWRGAPDEDGARTLLEGLAQEAEAAGFSTHWGRKVLEVRPPVPIDKGQAVRDLVTRSSARVGALRRRRRHRPRRLQRVRRAAVRAGPRRRGAGRACARTRGRPRSSSAPTWSWTASRASRGC